MSGGTNDTCRVAFIHHDECVIFLSQVADFVHRRHVSVHGEDAVGDDDAEALFLCCLKLAFEVFHVGVSVAVAFCFAEAHAVNDGSVVESVGDDGVVGSEERFEDTAVGIEASGIEDGVLGVEIVRDGFLEFFVYILRAADEAHAGHAVASAVHHVFRSLNEAGMVGESEVVVCAEVEHFVAFHLDGCLLGAFNQTFFFVETCLLDVLQFFLEMCLEFTLHNKVYIMNRIWFEFFALFRFFRERGLFFCGVRNESSVLSRKGTTFFGKINHV